MLEFITFISNRLDLLVKGTHRIRNTERSLLLAVIALFLLCKLLYASCDA